MINPTNLDETDAAAVHFALIVAQEAVESQPIPESFQKLSATERLQTAMEALPVAFIAQETGVTFVEHKEQMTQYYHLCAPMIVESKARTSAAGDWSTCIRFLNHDDEVVSMVILDSDIQCKLPSVIAQLVRKRFWVTPDKKYHGKIGSLILQWATPHRTTLVDRFGWTDDSYTAFVLGDGTVIGNVSVLPRPHLMSVVSPAARSRGTLKDWRANVASPAVGNPLMMSCISLAFAGPLFQLLGLEGGGLHVHGASSTGKSTLLRAANSVWSPQGELQSWNGTKNALEVIAAQHSGRLLALDEIGEADPNTIGETTYALANGKGRGRMTFNLEQRKLRWHLAVLSSGELSLGDHIGNAGKKTMAGQSVRLLDIPIETERHGAFRSFHDCATPAQFAQSINQRIAQSYGVAGPEFVRKLISWLEDDDRHEKLKAFHAKIMSSLRAGHKFPSDGLTERALQRFALIAAAGELATLFEITGWQTGEAIKAVKEVMKLWLQGRDLPTLRDLEATRDRVLTFVRVHSSKLMPLPATPAPLQPGKLGWIDQDTFYFSDVAWTMMHKGYDPRDSARQLRDAGALQCNDEGLQFKMPRAVVGRPRAYAVRRAWLDEATVKIAAE